MNWESKRIKDVATSIIGLTYSPEDIVDENEGVLVLRSGNIQDGKTNFIDNVYVKATIPDILQIKKDDILMCSRNGSANLVGKCALIDKDYDNCTWGAFMTVIRSKYAKYLYWIFNSCILTDCKGMFQTSTVNQLTGRILDNISIPFPPIETQEKISNLLNKNTQNIDKKLELLQKKKENYIILRKSIINEAINGIGKNWKTVRVKDLFEIYNGNGFEVQFQGNEKGDYPFCKASDINGCEKFISSAANFVNEDLIVSEKYTVIPKNSILFSKIGEALKKNHRKINSVPCIVDNNCAALVLKKKNYNIIFYYYVFYMLNMCKFDNGGTIPCVNSSQLLASTIVFPDIKIQNQVATYLDKKTSAIDSIVENITKEIDSLKTYRRALINEAITGKLNIE